MPAHRGDPSNPFRLDSFAVDPYPYQCMMPGCRYPVTEAAMLCELHT